MQSRNAFGSRQSHDLIVCKEVAVVGVTWPAEVAVSWFNLRGRTGVRLRGSIWGFGPVQSGHLKGQMGNLLSRIEVIAARVPAPATLKICPQCAEEIQMAAKICRFCRYQFSQ